MTRLVNVYIVHSIDNSGGQTYLHMTGADSAPDSPLEHAARTGAAGILIRDVQTGEQWLTPTLGAARQAIGGPSGAFG
jgi:hypothetical protein